MENQDLEYCQCLEQIELYRRKRELLFKEMAELRAYLDSIPADDNSPGVLEKQEKLENMEALDEEYGAKMHELAIMRNLLEP